MSGVYKDKALPFEERAAALVGEMTLEEKCSQLTYSAPAIKRLGIPAYNWWNEGLHGVARAGTATMFPQAIALAAMFDDRLLSTAAEVIAREARAKYNEAVKYGDRDIYKGLTLWAPNINIFRDPRWGRGQETYGEDPYLTSRLGCAFVKGLQGDGEYLMAAACAKHFAVHSGPEAVRHEFDAVVSEKDLEETYLPAFRALVCEAGVEGVMGAYNRINGEPACAHSYLGRILRQDWGFDGYFVSDCFAIMDFHTHHFVTKTAEESAALALKNGCDLNCGNTYLHLQGALKKGLVSEEEVDRAVIRLMTTRLRLGMLDKTPYDDIPFEVVACSAHQQIADKCCEESMVLLKNNGILPLQKEIGSIGVIGPNADSRAALVGNYEGTASRYVTILEGIQQAFWGRVYYAQGCDLAKDRTEPLAAAGDRIAEAVTVAEHADLVILCLGLDASLEGEEGDEGNACQSGDKEDIQLPKSQRELLHAVEKTGKPFIIVLASGSALAVPGDRAAAMVQMWYAGANGGSVLADILFGKLSPSGKLPVTFYKNADRLPPFTDYSMKGRTYRYTTKNVLYPFGYGLSYGNVVTKKLKCVHVPEGIRIYAEFHNDSEWTCDEVIQVYVGSDSKNAVQNVSLCEFRRVTFLPGEHKQISFLLQEYAFEVVNELGFRSIDTEAAYKIYAGTSQPDKRSEKLTGKKCLSVSITGARLSIICNQAKNYIEKKRIKTKADETAMHLQVKDRRKRGGRYLMDYGRQYDEPYDVEKKAREHMKYVRNRKPGKG